MPPRSRRDAVPNRQYDEFRSTDYEIVNISELYMNGGSRYVQYVHAVHTLLMRTHI